MNFKKNTTIFIAILLLSIINVSAKKDIPVYVSGKVVFNNKVIENAKIKIIDKNYKNVLDRVNTKNAGTFSLTLYVGFDYLIEVTKSNFFTYVFSFSTKNIPEEHTKGVDINFNLGDITLIEASKAINAKLSDKIIASIIYDKEKKKFIYEYDYRNSLLSEMEEYLSNEDYKKAISEGKKLFNLKQYKEAKEYYLKAKSLKPDEDLPKNKLIEIDKILTNKGEKEDEPTKEVITEEKPESEQITEKHEETEKEKQQSELSEKNLNKCLDELKNEQEQGNEKAVTEIMNKIGNIYHNQNNLTQAIDYYKKSLEKANNLGDNKKVSEIQNDMAIALYDSGMYENSLEYYQQSLQLKQQLNDKNGTIDLMKQMAVVYDNMFRYEKSINYYQQALTIVQDIGNEQEETKITNSIGDIYYEKNNLDKAVEYYEKSLEIDKKLDNKDDVAASLNNIGVIYYDMGNYEKSVDYYQQSIGVLEKLGNKKEISMSLNNIGNVNYDWNKYQKALEYYEKSLKIKEELDYKKGIASSMHNIGNIHLKLNHIDKAIEYFEKSNELATEINLKDIISRNYSSISEAFMSKKNYQKAMEFYKLYASSKYSLIKDEKHNQVSEMQIKYQVEKIKSQREIKHLKKEIEKQKLIAKYEADRNRKEIELKNLELKKKEAKVRMQKILNATFISGFVLVLIFTFLLLKQFNQKKKANKILAHQKKEITDSILYAKRIQEAVLPSPSILEKSLPQHFVLYKPKSIVSGDFYWIGKMRKKTIFTAADCTGHGVPGGFMSMLGITFLNDIINMAINLDAALILDELREYVISSLHQTGADDEAKDGMDIALCVYNSEKKQLQYAGANNPLYLIRNNELKIIKPDKMPIGIHAIQKKPFTNIEITLEDKDTIYIFSDGYIDQFGGPDNKRFSSKRFRELLINIHDKSMDEQKNILNENIENWKGNSEQIDDILVMGIKI
ncbi:MAG: tetratricopeptide repeat protein [Bacteroidales bacterium]|nr:tetratricopeptide repeat protein [Bacteroidales bacterium]